MTDKEESILLEHNSKHWNVMDEGLALVSKTAFYRGFHHKITESKRDYEKQERLYNSGKTKTLESRHCTEPFAKAFDCLPVPFEGWGDWLISASNYYAKGSDELEKVVKERGRFYHLAGVMLAIAKEKSVRVRWGGDWDSDGKFKDQSFDDLVHFEIPSEN